VSSLEEGSGAMPTYECCTFRGSLVSLDAASGRQLWKTYTITDPPKRTAKNSIGTQLWGPSGAAIWSAPTLDPDRNRLYVTTGDSYSNPVALASDAIMALAMDSGRILWVKQTLPGDAWNAGCLETTPEGRVNCPDVPGPDRGGSLNGPGATVAGGMLYMSSGYTLGFMPGNVLLAFSVDGQ
jgi:polyvinyl alcohol dehydrogenase (cytochrome)